MRADILGYRQTATNSPVAAGRFPMASADFSGKYLSAKELMSSALSCRVQLTNWFASYLAWDRMNFPHVPIMRSIGNRLKPPAGLHTHSRGTTTGRVAIVDRHSGTRSIGPR